MAQGMLPPRPMASKASCRQGNFSRSGSKNVRAPRVLKSSLFPSSGRRVGYASARAMGRRISGQPSWAITAPSSNSTMEWMTDSGCTTTWMRSASTPKSHLASMTSKPLFIMVAESMVILAPISQLGCFSAWALVAPAIFSLSQVRKGPPEAVRWIWRRGFPSAPSRHWKMAECSESTG